ncbi:MAG: SH3 domain-containing protein [Chloroflexi bacterium]|nr:SH3 domain-containing protein [Chloroflexota bacterium]
MKKILATLPALFLVACQFANLANWQPAQALQDLRPTVTSTTAAEVQPTDATQPTLTPSACVVIASDALNLRRGPGLSFDVIAWLNPGERLTILQTCGAWAEVQTDQGARGWVKQIYCRGQ